MTDRIFDYCFTDGPLNFMVGQVDNPVDLSKGFDQRCSLIRNAFCFRRN